MPEQNDDALIRENERLALSLRALGSGVWDYDIDTDFLVCTAGWYSILGLDPEGDRVSSVVDFQRYIHPDDIGPATEIDWEEVNLLIAEDRPYHREFRIIRGDGSIRWLHSVACVIRDAETGRHRAVGCITDVTAAKVKDDAAAGDGPVADGTRKRPKGRSLSLRERECLRWVSLGKTAWETAVILGLSQRTVEFHLAKAMKKLGAVNKVHAAAIAIRDSLV